MPLKPPPPPVPPPPRFEGKSAAYAVMTADHISGFVGGFVAALILATLVVLMLAPSSQGYQPKPSPSGNVKPPPRCP